MLVDDDFARLTGPLRPELLAHCYRMLGSATDAEDQLQETLIRAWRSYEDFEGRSSLRTWLYRIATNACLRALENQSRRPLPSGLGAPADSPDEPIAPGRGDIPWLQPIPDVLVTDDSADPASIAVSRASVRLALVAALQYLPARQRAVLILRDVLRWRAAEVADLLGITVTAANSLLQRAREQLSQHTLAEDELSEPADPVTRRLLDRYVSAFQNADAAGLAALLRADAVLEMPPVPTWFAGRERVVRFLSGQVLHRPGRFRLVPVGANGQPAFAEYLITPDGGYQAFGVQVLTVRGSGIGRITAFVGQPELVSLFGLPPCLPAELPRGREHAWARVRRQSALIAITGSTDIYHRAATIGPPLLVVTNDSETARGNRR
jgi:RNA polymerase sigma-70 factor (ECF subfamily)